MQEDISLLPEDMRSQEEKEKTKTFTPPALPGGANGLKMHVPETQADEDIEIIEVDEGDLAAVLSDEPLLTRAMYQVALFFDKAKSALLKHDDSAPTAKAPPKFFEPPRSGLVSPPQKSELDASSSSQVKVLGPTSIVHTQARITPHADVPHRVRVIRRVRKPVRVSLISSQEIAELTVDIGRRKWTLGITLGFFMAILITGYIFLSQQVGISKARFDDASSQLTNVQTEAQNRLKDWSQFEDLEARLRLLNSALNDHIVITRLFDFIESITLPTITYRSAVFGKDGLLGLDVIATSYDDASAQMIAYEADPRIKRVEAGSFSLERGDDGVSVKAVTFQVNIEIDPNSFKGAGITESSGSSSSTSSLLQSSPVTP